MIKEIIICTALTVLILSFLLFMLPFYIFGSLD